MEPQEPPRPALALCVVRGRAVASRSNLLVEFLRRANPRGAPRISFLKLTLRKGWVIMYVTVVATVLFQVEGWGGRSTSLVCGVLADPYFYWGAG
jgi:hypothetical protein